MAKLRDEGYRAAVGFCATREIVGYNMGSNDRVSVVEVF